MSVIDYITERQLDITLTTDELNAFLGAYNSNAVQSNVLAQSETTFGALDGISVSNRLFYADIDIYKIIDGYHTYNLLSEEIRLLNSAVGKIDTYFGNDLEYLRDSTAFQGVLTQIHSMNDVANGPLFDADLEALTRNFVQGLEILLTAVPTAFEAAKLTFLRGSNVLLQKATGLADTIADTKNAVALVLAGPQLNEILEIAEDITDLSGKTYDLLKRSYYGEYAEASPLLANDLTQWLTEVTELIDTLSPDIGEAETGGISALGLASEILEATQAIHKNVEAVKALKNGYGTVEPVVQNVMNLAYEDLVLETFNHLVKLMQAIGNSEALEDFIPDNTLFDSFVNFGFELVSDVLDVARIENRSLLEAMESNAIELKDLVLGTHRSYSIFMKDFERAVAEQPPVIAFEQARLSLDSLAVTAIANGVLVLDTLLSDMDADVIAEAGGMLGAGDILVFAAADPDDVPFEVLYVSADGRLGAYHARDSNGAAGQFAFSWAQDMASITAPDVTAIATALKQQVDNGIFAPLASLITSQEIIEATRVFSFDVAAPPVEVTPAAPTVIVTQATDAGGSQPAAVDRQPVTPVEPEPTTAPNVIDLSDPIISQPALAIPLASAALSGSNIRTIALDQGDQKSAVAPTLAGGARVIKLDLSDGGDLAFSASHWGGPDVSVTLYRDKNLDGFGTTSEVLAQTTLSQAGQTQATLSVNDLPYGTYFAVVAASNTGGLTAEVTGKFALSQAGGSTPAPVDDPVVVPIVDQFTFQTPGGLDDDNSPRIGTINVVGDQDPFYTNVLVGGRSYVLNVVAANGAQGLQDFDVVLRDEQGDLLGAVLPDANGLANYEIIVPEGASGRYTFVVAGVNGATGDYSIRYRDNGVVLPDDDHPDGQSAQIVVDVDTLIRITDSDDVDSFQINLVQGNKYTTILDPFAGAIAPLVHGEMSIYKPDGTLLAQRYGETSSLITQQFVAPETGTYTVSVTSLLGGSGQANLRITDQGTSTAAPPSLAAATAQGPLSPEMAYDDPTYVQNTMTSSGHSFDVSVSPGALFEFRVREVGSEPGSLTYAIYNAAGDEILPDGVYNIPNGKLIELRTSPDETGQYTVVVAHTELSNTAFTYEVALQVTDDLPHIPADALPLVMGVPVIGHAESGAYDDFFSLEGLSGPVSFSLANPTAPAGQTWDQASGVQVKVVDADSRVVAYERLLDLNVGTFDVTLPDEGTYFLQVLKYGSAGAYQITASPVSDDIPADGTTSETMTLGTPITGVQETYGDQDAFGFTLFAGSTLDFSKSVATGPVGSRVVQIINRDTGEVLLEEDDLSFQWVVPHLGGVARIDALLVVKHRDGAPASDASADLGGYTVLVSDVTPDDRGNTIVGAEQVAVGQTTTVTLENATDKDMLGIGQWDEGHSGEVRLSPQVQAAQALAGATVRVLNSDGIVIANGVADQTGAVAVSFVGNGGDLYVQIAAFGAQSFGTATLDIAETGIVPVFDAATAVLPVGEAVELGALMRVADSDGATPAAWRFSNQSAELGELVDAQGRVLGPLVERNNAEVFFRAFDDAAASDAQILVQMSLGGAFSPWQTLRLSLAVGAIPDVTGTESDEKLVGTTAHEVLEGNGGRDVLLGQGGDDSVFGGAGNDILFGGGGADLLDGGAGFDMADYSDAVDDLLANINFGGAQTVSAAMGTDTFVSIEGLTGGSGNDLLVGSAAGNVIDGGAGDDEIYGIGGSDILRGGSGNDQIEGSGGNDTMVGGAGTDDVLSYYNAAGGVRVNLRLQGEAQSVGGSSGVDVFSEFENLYGSNAGADILVGSIGDNLLLGFAGGDQLFGFDGVDHLIGMQGADTLVGGQGADTLSGGGGADTFVYNFVTESTYVSRDTIADFGVGGADTVDLSMIDANSLLAGDQAFNFVGSNQFAEAGDLRFVTDGTDGFVLGDVDGNGTNDLNIMLLGITAMGVDDFEF